MNANTEHPKLPRRRASEPVYTALLTTTALIVLAVFVYRPGINGYPNRMFGEMIYGEAAKPFVYRALLPTCVRTLTSIIPEQTRASWGKAASASQAGANALKILRWEQRYLVEYLIACVLMYLALLGFAWSLRRLLEESYKTSELVAKTTVLVALLALIPQFRYYSYIYDFPTLLLFTYGLSLMQERRWGAFLMIFAAATINKETAILLTMVFAIHFFKRGKLSRSRYWLLGAAQLVIFVSIKAALTCLYRNNPGEFIEWHLEDHNLVILQNAYPECLLWVGFVLMLFARWRDKPEFLRDALCPLAPLVLLTTLFGFLDEFRDYYEAYPAIVLLMLHSIELVVGFEAASKDAGLEASASSR